MAAITASKGMIGAAARMVGCHRDTITDMAKRRPEVQEVIEAETELALDLTVLALFKAIDAGNVQAIKFFLLCKGRDRGYVLKSDVVVSGGVSQADLITGSVEREAQQKRG